MSLLGPKSVCRLSHPHGKRHRVRDRRENRWSRARDGKAGSDPSLLHWLDMFHFFHTDCHTCTPVALRLDADCPAAYSAEESQGTQEPAATSERYVFEVALCRDGRGERWMLICWELDVPGILYCDCANQEEAMALFAEPSKTVGRWYGVRLRRERRPW